jgi:hypothetical protein
MVLRFNHDNKAAIIWNSFKDRLGVTTNLIMSFNLDHIVQSHDLSQMDTPFSMEEIEDVMKEIPDRSPRPDGFNGVFSEKCWNTIKDDFTNIVKDFYDERLNLESINTTHITLTKKTMIHMI